MVLFSVFISRGGYPIQEEPKKIERIFYTFQETQEFLNVSHETLYQLMMDKGALTILTPGVTLSFKGEGGYRTITQGEKVPRF